MSLHSLTFASQKLSFLISGFHNDVLIDANCNVMEYVATSSSSKLSFEMQCGNDKNEETVTIFIAMMLRHMARCRALL